MNTTPKMAGALVLVRRGWTRRAAAEACQVSYEGVCCAMKSNGVTAPRQPTGPERSFDYDKVARLVASGVTYAETARRCKISIKSVANAVRATGASSPNCKWRDVPCPSCGGERGVSTLMCSACDRARHRNGLCPGKCGLPIRKRAGGKCPRCKAAWPVAAGPHDRHARLEKAVQAFITGVGIAMACAGHVRQPDLRAELKRRRIRVQVKGPYHTLVPRGWRPSRNV